MPEPQIHFIVSAPRSGSTWLARAINHHPEIFATEHRLFGNFFETWPNNNGRLAPRITFDAYVRSLSVHYFHEHTSESRGDFIDEFTADYARFIMDFAQRKSGKSVLIDKITPYPGTSRLVVEQIKKHFPDSQIIQLVRDGRDVATSGVFDWLLKDSVGTPRHQYFVAQEPSLELKRFFDDESIERWAGNWKETVQVFRKSPAAMKITYESMLADQGAILQSIFELLKVDASADLASDCSQQEAFEVTTGRSSGNMDPLAKQRNGVAGDWQNYMTRDDGQLFHQAAGQQLIAEGYESDASWIENLPNELSLKP